MKKILQWLTKWNNARELRGKISTLKSNVRAEKKSNDDLLMDIMNLEHELRSKDDDISRLNQNISIQKEELEVERSKLRISEVEINELSALCANRLKRIEGGDIDCRQEDRNE